MLCSVRVLSHAVFSQDPPAAVLCVRHSGDCSVIEGYDDGVQLRPSGFLLVRQTAGYAVIIWSAFWALYVGFAFLVWTRLASLCGRSASLPLQQRRRFQFANRHVQLNSLFKDDLMIECDARSIKHKRTDTKQTLVHIFLKLNDPLDDVIFS